MLGIHDERYLSVYYQEPYSPLTMSEEWSKTFRLLFVLFCISFGSIMNIFFVTSFYTERQLKRVANIYLACAGIADMFITAGVMPISAVVLLSGQWDNLFVCRIAQIGAETATYAYSWFFLMFAGENFYWICRSMDYLIVHIHMQIGTISILIYCITFSLAAGGVLFQLDYDYCTRESFGNLSFRISTSVIFHGIFPILTLGCLLAAMIRLRRRAREEVTYGRSRIYRREYSFTAMNLTAYVLFLLSWIPYGVIVYKFPDISDDQYYKTVWIGLLRSVFVSFIYGIINRKFSHAYSRACQYSCCKRPLSDSIARRRRRALDLQSTTDQPNDPSGNVIDEIVSYSHSPYRAPLRLLETEV